LEDLFPNTVYNIKITARSTYGEGPHSSIIQVKTNEAGWSRFYGKLNNSNSEVLDLKFHFFIILI